MKRFIIAILPLIVVGVVILIKLGDNSSAKIEPENTKKRAQETDTKNREIDLFDNEISETSTSTPQLPFQNTQVSFSLEIKGNDEFRTKVKNAVRLLWLYDKEGSFKALRRYIFEIRQSNRTTFFFDGENPVIELSDNMVSNLSITYLASIIAHNMWHGWYLTEKNLKKKKAKEVPPPTKQMIEKTFITPFGNEFKKYEDLFMLEEEATNYQIRILEKINAPQSEIKHLLKRDRKDFSHAHDGNFIIQY